MLASGRGRPKGCLSCELPIRSPRQNEACAHEADRIPFLHELGNAIDGSQVPAGFHGKGVDPVGVQVAHRREFPWLDAGKFCMDSILRKPFSKQLLNAFGPREVLAIDHMQHAHRLGTLLRIPSLGSDGKDCIEAEGSVQTEGHAEGNSKGRSVNCMLEVPRMIRMGSKVESCSDCADKTVAES